MATQKLPPGADRTQRMSGAERTQRMDPERIERDGTHAAHGSCRPQSTQRIDLPPVDTQRLGPTPQPLQRGEGDKTMKIQNDPIPGVRSQWISIRRPRSWIRAHPRTRTKLDPGTTQKMDAAPSDPVTEQTQRLDDSIWRLQEAKRILQGVREKY